MAGKEALISSLPTPWLQGGYGAKELGEAVARVCDAGKADFKFLYPDDMSIKDKIEKVHVVIFLVS